VSASREEPQGHEAKGSVPALEVRAPLPPSAVRIAYQMVRHALGKWGTTKVIALDIRREGDTVVLTPVSSRHRPLQHYIEVPFTSEVLGVRGHDIVGTKWTRHHGLTNEA
jgi:hypothetical protein